MVKIKSNYFNKKLIIISGANSGIGSEIAKQFLKYDVELVLLNKNLKINNSLQDNINNSNAKVEIFSFDFNDFYNSEELVTKIENKFKKKVVTFVRKFEIFYKAEDKHQDYYQEYLLNYLMYKKSCGREELLKRIWKR